MSPYLIIFQRINTIYSPFLNLGMTRPRVRKLSHAHLPGYQCIEKVCPRSILHSTRSTTNHGGTCLFLKAHYTARVVLLPDYETTEVLAVYIQAATVELLVAILYRPGSNVVCSKFIDEFADIIERTSI